MILTYKDFEGIMSHIKYVCMLAHLREKLLVNMTFKPPKGSFHPMYHFDGNEALKAMSRGAINNRGQTVNAYNYRLAALKEAISRREQCE